MSSIEDFVVAPELVRVAIAVAERRREDVADVPLIVLAEAAGISRSTLVRRLGGSRRSLDEAVRAFGVDPGGRVPVRQRAVEAAARVIHEQGLAAATLETVAAAAGCSVHSLYATFGGRDGLFTAIYESYSPLLEIERLLTLSEGDLEQTARGVYRAFVTSLGRQPQVARAMLADAFSRPDGAAGRLVQRYFPRALHSIGGWMAAEVAAGRVRDVPIVLLIHQLIGPLVVHLLSRPMLPPGEVAAVPDMEQVCQEFAQAFVRAVAVPETAAPVGIESSARNQSEGTVS